MSYLSFNRNSSDAANLNEIMQAAQIDVSKPLMLQYSWVLWEQVSSEFSRGNNTNYQDCMKPLATFNSVQGFWQLWNKLPQPSDLLGQKSMSRIAEDGMSRTVDALMIFRENVKPMWEDPANHKGGHFEIKITPTEYPPNMVDEIWNNIVLSVIGGGIDSFPLVTGVRLVDKLNISSCHIRIEIWYTHSEDAGAFMALQKDLQRCMSERLNKEEDPIRIPKMRQRSHYSSH